MIDIDWTLITTVNGWQSLATISIAIVALFVVTRFLIKFWPWLKKVIALFDALGQLPAFIQRTDNAIADIHHEVKYNNGSSVKDAVGRVEIGVRALHAKVDEQKATLEAADAALRRELEDTRPSTPKPAPRKPRTKKEQ